MTDAVMFDCDGVLVDSETLIAELLVEMANERGGSLTLVEGCEMFHGVQLASCAERISAHLGRSVTPEIIAEYPRRSAEVFRHRLTAVDGVEELLESLTVPICVVTNSARRKAVANLEITRLAKYFVGHVYSAADVRRFKPEPDVYLHASAGLGVEPSRCVAIEDSAVGVRSAANAGMAVIGFGRPALRASGARWTRESMREIADLMHSFE